MVTLLARLEDAVQVLEVTVHEAAHHAPFLADVHWVEEGDRFAPPLSWFEPHHC